MATFILTLKRQRRESQGWSRAHGTLCLAVAWMHIFQWDWGVCCPGESTKWCCGGLHCWAFTVPSLLTGSWLLWGCSAFRSVLSYGGHRIFWLFAAWISVVGFGIPVFATHISHTDTLPYSHTHHMYMYRYISTHNHAQKTHSWFVHQFICSVYVFGSQPA